MTPQEQKNRLNDIMFHAQRCELYDDEHRLYAKMGLGITIYFYGGGSESGQRKVLDVFRKYQERYGEYLKGMFGGGGGSKFMQYTPQRFTEHISKLRGFAEKDKRISFSMGSDRWGDYASDYSCETLTTSPTGESVYNLVYRNTRIIATNCPAATRIRPRQTTVE